MRSSALVKCQSSNSESRGYVALLTNEALNFGFLCIKVARQRQLKANHHSAKGEGDQSEQPAFSVLLCAVCLKRRKYLSERYLKAFQVQVPKSKLNTEGSHPPPLMERIK